MICDIQVFILVIYTYILHFFFVFLFNIFMISYITNGKKRTIKVQTEEGFTERTKLLHFIWRNSIHQNEYRYWETWISEFGPKSKHKSKVKDQAFTPKATKMETLISDQIKKQNPEFLFPCLRAKFELNPRHSRDKIDRRRRWRGILNLVPVMVFLFLESRVKNLKFKREVRRIRDLGS